MPGFLAAMALASLATAPLQPMDQDVHIGRGDQALYGALLRPAATPASPAPAVLLLAGSGPENRDGDDVKDGERAHTLKLLAHGLADHGLTTLRIDKRGVGASARAALPPQDTKIGTLVADAAAWAKFLRAQPGVRCVVILGHSEGALIAALAAQKVKTCGVVSVSGSARDLGALIESQNGLAGRSPALIKQTHQILSLRAGQPVTDVPPALKGVFGPDAQAYTMSMINIDPVAELGKVKAPVLVLQGDNDLQVKVEDARALAARPGARLVIVHGMTHPLKLAAPGIAANFQTYTNPELPLAPEVIPAIVDFIGAKGR